MSTRIGIGSTDAPPPPRGARLNGAARRLTPELPEERSSAAASPPRPMLLAAGALAILTIALAAGARLTGGGHMPVPVAPVDVARDFRFEDGANGAVIVHARATDGPERQVAVLAPGEMMFVRSTLRALARGRRIDGMAQEEVPFRITRYRDGRVTLDDLATKQHVELSAFGPTNAAAFESLLQKARD